MIIRYLILFLIFFVGCISKPMQPNIPVQKQYIIKKPIVINETRKSKIVTKNVNSKNKIKEQIAQATNDKKEVSLEKKLDKNEKLEGSNQEAILKKEQKEVVTKDKEGMAKIDSAEQENNRLELLKELLDK